MTAFRRLAIVLVSAACSSSSKPRPQVSCGAPVARELSVIEEHDQAAIQASLGAHDPAAQADAAARYRTITRDNALRLDAIVDACGWPTVHDVGAAGADAAWLICQHADHDLAFQQRCLGWIERAVTAGQARAESLAYPVDRARMNSGQPQIYGTQLRAGADGKPELVPIEDPDHVDERRMSVGLCRLALYVAGDDEGCARDAASSDTAGNAAATRAHEP
jgi:hypothetical protein